MTNKFQILMSVVILLLSITVVYYVTAKSSLSIQEHLACANPFAGTPSLKFKPQLWTTQQLARYVNPGVLDSNEQLHTNFCKHSVDYAKIISGGPPPDGIPPLDNPRFESITQGEQWLVDGQPVIAVVSNQIAKAYPLAILTRHEIANNCHYGLC